MVKIGVIGSGYWGPNLIRNLYNLDDRPLHAVSDLLPERLAFVGRQYPAVHVTGNYQDLFSGPTEVDALVIATPARTHFKLAREALEQGKHVMVEKPMAMTVDECAELIDIARRRGVILMAGHTFLYSSALLHLKKMITDGALGDIHYLYSARLNLGQIRQDVNSLWNLAPHDVSIGLFLLNESPTQVTARGYSYLQPGIEDVVFANFDFASGIGMNVHVSWLDPGKVRRLTVVGSKRMAIYDDTNVDSPIQVFDKGVSREGAMPQAPSFGNFGEFKLQLRSGDVHIPKIPSTEPLRAECEHFLACIRTGDTPRTDGASALPVVAALVAAQQSIDLGGVTVSVEARDTTRVAA